MKRVHRLFLALVLVLAAALLSAQTWSELQSGNVRFRSGSLSFTGLNAERNRLRPPGKQEPKVTILSCADSRVPPELIFHQTLGKLFVVRVAGNVADQFPIASLKYAKSQAGFTNTVIVLGHQDCGAVIEAMKPESQWPNDADVKALLRQIKTNIAGETNLQRAIEANARASAANVRQKVGLQAVKAAYYNMVTGQVIELAP